MSGSIDQFMTALFGAESGGNYNATNKDSGAYGKYQIMPQNWPSWAREAGLPEGAQPTPENQERVARAKIQQYYDKFGNWADVAAAWYSGQPLNEATADLPQNGYPSIRSYVNTVLSSMGETPMSGGNRTGTDPGLEKMRTELRQRSIDAYNQFAKTKSDADYEAWQNAQADYAIFMDDYVHENDLGDQQAQQGFENSLAIGDRQLNEAQLAWTKYRDKIGEARANTEGEITAANTQVERELGAREAASKSGMWAGATGRFDVAPNYSKSLEKWKGTLGAGAEPSSELGDYAKGYSPPVFSSQQPEQFDGSYSLNFKDTNIPGAGGWARGAPGGGFELSVPPTGTPYGPGIDESGRFDRDKYGATDGSSGGGYGAYDVFGNPGGAIADAAWNGTPIGDKVSGWWRKGTSKLHDLGIPFFAGGVVNYKGGPAVVNENGGETILVPGQEPQQLQGGTQLVDLPPGSDVLPAGVPPDEAMLFAQIRRAASEQAPQGGSTPAEQAARANDPQLQEKVMAALRSAMAAEDASNPPKTPQLTGQWSRPDPWADWRQLTGVPAVSMPQEAPTRG